MKVFLRQFPGDLIPVRRWRKNYEYRRSEILDDWSFDPEEGDELDRIVDKILDYLDRITNPINKWWEKLTQVKYVKVDYQDIWNANETLALLIVPILKKLKEHKHGSPYVDQEDVPEHLHRKQEPGPDNNWADDTVHDRWAWVLDEMIWTFEQELYNWEAQYCHNSDQLEMKSVPVEGKSYYQVQFNHQKDPSKPKYWRDREGIQKHQERIKNGRRLFAKYYDGLWD